MRFIVMAPLGSKSGGPEALHQLHYALTTLGQDSYLLAVPGTSGCKTISEYDCYLPRYISEEDLEKGDILVVPEFLDSLPKSIYSNVGKIVYWWLSVDNSPYFIGNSNSAEVQIVRSKWLAENIPTDFDLHPESGENIERENAGKKIIRICKSVKLALFIKRNFTQLKMEKVSHAFQSEYARKSLWETHKIKGLALSDYINDSQEFVNHSGDVSKKSLVAYNGIKGAELVQALEVLLRDEIDFLPLKSFNKEELSNIFAKSDLCLDLGHFPGKDRLPREALRAGCPILISKFGAGENDIDFRISEEFKLDLEYLELEYVADKLRQILSQGKEINLAKQKSYRDYLFHDQEDFMAEVQSFVDFCHSSFLKRRWFAARAKKL